MVLWKQSTGCWTDVGFSALPRPGLAPLVLSVDWLTILCNAVVSSPSITKPQGAWLRLKSIIGVRDSSSPFPVWCLAVFRLLFYIEAKMSQSAYGKSCINCVRSKTRCALSNSGGACERFVIPCSTTIVIPTAGLGKWTGSLQFCSEEPFTIEVRQRPPQIFGANKFD
jgi:hypothetical protein